MRNVRELLAVLGAVGLLAVCLLPACLRAGRLDAQATCAANLRALYVAATAYAADHDGVLPAAVTQRPAGQV